MSAEGNGVSATYRVIWTQAVKQQVRILAERADALGFEKRFLENIREADRRMSVAPLTWGDPEYELKQLGLRKCHGVLGTIIVYFAVDEARLVVYVLEVRPAPGQQVEPEQDE